MKTAISAVILATLIQLPLQYFFASLEGLVLGHGFIGAPSGITFYLVSILLYSVTVISLLGLPIYFARKRIKLNAVIHVAAVGAAIPVLILCALNVGVTDYEGFYSRGELLWHLQVYLC